MLAPKQSLCARHPAVSGSAVSLNGAVGVAAVGGPSGLCTLDLEWPWEPNQWLPHDDQVVALAWHPSTLDALILAAAGESGTISLYDLGAASAGSSLAARWRTSSAADALAWSSATGHGLATRSADGVVAIWDARSLQRIELGGTAASAPEARVTTLANGGALAWGAAALEHALAASRGGDVRVWDVRQPRAPVVELLGAHDGCVLSLSWRPAPDDLDVGELLLSCGSDGAVRLWQMSGQRLSVDAPAPADAAAPSGGTLLASATSASMVHHACCLPPSSSVGGADAAAEAIAVTVSDAPDAHGDKAAQPLYATDGPTARGLQAWYLARAADDEAAGAVRVALCASEWVPAGMSQRVTCVTGDAGQAQRAARAAGGPSLLRSAGRAWPSEGLSLASIGHDQCLRLWSLPPVAPRSALQALPPPPSASDVPTATSAAASASAASASASAVDASPPPSVRSPLSHVVQSACAGSPAEAPSADAPSAEVPPTDTPPAPPAPPVLPTPAPARAAPVPLSPGWLPEVQARWRSQQHGLGAPRLQVASTSAANASSSAASALEPSAPGNPSTSQRAAGAGAGGGGGGGGGSGGGGSGGGGGGGSALELLLVCGLWVHEEEDEEPPTAPRAAADDERDSRPAPLRMRSSPASHIEVGAPEPRGAEASAMAERMARAELVGDAAAGAAAAMAVAVASGGFERSVPPPPGGRPLLSRMQSAPSMLRAASSAPRAPPRPLHGAAAVVGRTAGRAPEPSRPQSPSHLAWLRLRIHPGALTPPTVTLCPEAEAEVEVACGLVLGAQEHEGDEAHPLAWCRPLRVLREPQGALLQEQLAASLAEGVADAANQLVQASTATRDVRERRPAAGGGGAGGGGGGGGAGFDSGLGDGDGAPGESAGAASAEGLVALVLSCLHALLVGAQRAQASIEMSRWRQPGGGGGGFRTAPNGSRLDAIAPSGSGFFERGMVPPPRTCGARFNASGLLACFYHSPSPYAGLNEAEMPRTYADFQGLVRGWQLAPIVELQRAMHMGGLAGAWDGPSLLGGEDAEDEDIDDEGETYGDGDERNTDRSALLRPPSPTALAGAPHAAAGGSGAAGAAGAGPVVGERARGGLARKGTRQSSGRTLMRGLGDAARGATLLVDSVALAEVDRPLAAQYLVAARRSAPASSASVLCQHNAAVALAHGRPELWRVWMMAACTAAAQEPRHVTAGSAAFGIASPVLSAIVLERLSLRDVQTVALLSCLSVHARGRTPLLPREHEAIYRRCRQIYCDLLVRWRLIVPLAEVNKFGGSGPSPVEAPPPPPGAAPAPAGTMLVSVTSTRAPAAHAVGGSVHAAGGAAAAGAPGSTPAGGAFLGGGGRRLLGTARDGQLRACASSTSSLGNCGVGCWYVGGVDTSTTQGSLPSVSTSTQSLPTVDEGPSEALPARRGECTRCAVCQLPARGLVWYCGVCGHGGHLQCMRGWFGAQGGGLARGGCPTGCGCRCLYAAPPEPPPPEGLDDSLVASPTGRSRSPRPNREGAGSAQRGARVTPSSRLARPRSGSSAFGSTASADGGARQRARSLAAVLASP